MKWPMGTKMFFSCGPESNDTQYDQLLPDLTGEPKLGGRSNFEIVFLGAKLGITRFVSMREGRWCKCVAVGPIVCELL